MKTYTQARHESYLNDLFQSQDPEAVFQQHEYLCNSSRPGSITTIRLRTYINDGRMGTLLRRLDPVAFQVSYNDETR